MAGVEPTSFLFKRKSFTEGVTWAYMSVAGVEPTSNFFKKFSLTEGVTQTKGLSAFKQLLYCKLVI